MRRAGAPAARVLPEGREISLLVDSDNAPALGLYRSCGFREAAVVEYYRAAL